MLPLPTKDEFREKYIAYANQQFRLIKERQGKLGDDIHLKLQHGLSMMVSNEEITKKSGLFNETYYLSSALEGCGHDIGRFAQYYASGTLKDADSKKFTGCKDHGNLGRKVLKADNKELLRFFLPTPSYYDKIFLEVIGEHTKIRNPQYFYSIADLGNIFQNLSLEEVVYSKDVNLKSKLIALKTKLLQEVDSIELLQNIINQSYTPKISNRKENFATKEVWDDFIHFRYIDIAYHKLRNTWTSNCGFLLRYGLLTHQMNLVGTLKQFQESNSFQKLWERTENSVVDDVTLDDPLLKEAQSFIQLAVCNLIACSFDGLLITPDSRLKAKEKTLREWGR